MFENIFYSCSIVWLVGLFAIDSGWGSDRVLSTNITDRETEKATEKIKRWAIQHMKNNKISHHWWYLELSAEVKTWVDVCTLSSKIKSMFASIFVPLLYNVDIIPEMNEIYISGEDRMNEYMQSDRVFYIPHIDGPFLWIPFVSVYRCMIGLNENTKIVTHFPIPKKCQKVQQGDVLAFDFNREIHYISVCTESKKISHEPRVALKIHYCIYPKCMYWLGMGMYSLNVMYNRTMRDVFLETIQPDTYVSRLKGSIVVIATHSYVFIERNIGYRNILYILLFHRMLQTSYISKPAFSIMMILPVVYRYSQYVFSF